MRNSAFIVGALVAVASVAFAGDVEDLHAAAQNGDLAKVKVLLEKGVDVNAKSKYGATALSFACDKGAVDIVKLLLEKNADVNVEDTFYHATPVTWAVMKERYDIAALLIEHGATGSDQLLMTAASEGQVALAKACVEHGKPSPEALTKALQTAERKNHPEVAEIFKKAGAMPSSAPAVSVSTERLAALSGTYKNAQIGVKIIFRAEDGALKGVVPGQPEITYAPTAPDTFESVEYPGVTIIFPANEPKPNKLTLKQGGATFDFDRETADASAAAASAPVPASAPTVAFEEPKGKVEKPLNWPQFRGPKASGVADGQFPPTRWDVKSGENVRWKTPLPGLSHASPIVWGDRVFVLTATSGGEDELRHGLFGDTGYATDFEKTFKWDLVCLDKKTGNVLWQKTGAEGKPPVKRHTKATHANSTPATDGQRVIALLASQYLCAFDFDGTQLWKQDLGVLDSGWFYDAEYQWGFGASPIIWNDLVILQCDVQKQPFIAAWNVKTGERVWTTPRDEVCSWASGAVFDFDSGSELVTNGTRAIRGYNPRDGKELWKLVGNSEVCVPTPIFAGGNIFITSGYSPMQPIYAIKPGARGDISLTGDALTNDKITWSTKRGGPYMQTPIAYGDLLYASKDNGVLTVYNIADGKKLYTERLGGGGAFTASPVAADGRIYFTSEDGDIIVIRHGEKFEKLAESSIGEVCMATPAISDGLFIVRTDKSVFAFGAGKGVASAK